MEETGKAIIKTNKYTVAIWEYLRYIQDRIKKTNDVKGGAMT